MCGGGCEQFCVLLFLTISVAGAGKTTISRLFFRFYDVLGGAVKVNGQDVRSISQKSLRGAIGVVPQNGKDSRLLCQLSLVRSNVCFQQPSLYPSMVRTRCACFRPVKQLSRYVDYAFFFMLHSSMFNDTVRANLRYGRRDATEEEVDQAARDAQLFDFIGSLENGWDTTVGDRGLKLSGGEKQRAAIARCLLKDPPFVCKKEVHFLLLHKEWQNVPYNLLSCFFRKYWTRQLPL